MFACVGILATASRMLWAFAREGGVPFSGYIARVGFSRRASRLILTHVF